MKVLDMKEEQRTRQTIKKLRKKVQYNRIRKEQKERKKEGRR